MQNVIGQPVIDKLRGLYQSDPAAKVLFDWTANREKDATSTSIDRICSQLEISRRDALILAHRLHSVGCGRFVVGRRGQKSRFEWAYSCISLGRAARGESSILERARDPISDENEDDMGDQVVTARIPEGSMTIAEAKAALSASLGVPVSSVEIIIRV